MSFTHNAPDKPLRAARAPVHSDTNGCCASAERALARLVRLTNVKVTTQRLVWNTRQNKYTHVATVVNASDNGGRRIWDLEFDGVAWIIIE